MYDDLPALDPLENPPELHHLLDAFEIRVRAFRYDVASLLTRATFQQMPEPVVLQLHRLEGAVLDARAHAIEARRMVGDVQLQRFVDALPEHGKDGR